MFCSIWIRETSLPLLVLLFIVLPLVEISVLIEAGRLWGAWHTVLLIILTGILGAAIARWQGLSILFQIQNDMREGRVPTDKMLEGVLILIAGVVLLTPGFITDALGFFVLWPTGRAVIRKMIMKRFETSHSDPNSHTNIRYFKQEDP
jgi:UPF0716 protein FxsA